MLPKLDKSIQIGELVTNYPEAVEVLFEYGFHCIGCGLSAYETLEQGAAAHGFDEKTVEEMLEKIRKATESSRAKREAALQKGRLAEMEKEKGKKG